MYFTHASPRVITPIQSTQVYALPRPLPVSSDPGGPAPTADSNTGRQPLYSLHGGSVTLGRPSGAAVGVAVGAAEIVVAFADKLRIWDFSAP